MPKISQADEIRNARVATGLIACMTVGALVLLALEPSRPAWPGPRLLMAEGGTRVSSATLEVLGPNAESDLAQFDGVIFPDGQLAWAPKSSDVIIGIVSHSQGGLPEAQSSQVLSVLGNLRFGGGLELSGIALAASSDPLQHPDLPATAHELRGLLVRKGFIR